MEKKERVEIQKVFYEMERGKLTEDGEMDLFLVFLSPFRERERERRRWGDGRKD